MFLAEVGKQIGAVTTPTVDLKPTAEEMATWRNNPIGAIKAHRTRTGSGLKDSKDILEREAQSK